MRTKLVAVAAVLIAIVALVGGRSIDRPTSARDTRADAIKQYGFLVEPDCVDCMRATFNIGPTTAIDLCLEQARRRWEKE